MAITSAQGIASLYRGNPQPLQQVIQKEQQAKPGLPPDLQKLLALQIVNNEENGFAAQKAMDQLKQMSGGQGGKPPTVMASLQQQAQQKMQAQAQLARQQAAQRGLPINMGEPPQPESQPVAQGIDQLPAEFDMAEGGIVAFSGKDRSDVPEEGLSKYAEVPKLAAELGIPVALYRQVADVASRMGTTVGEILKTMGKDAVRPVASVARTAMTAPAGAVAVGGIPATQFAGDVIRAASPEKRAGFYDNPMVGAMGGDTAMAAAIMNAAQSGQQDRSREEERVAAANRTALNRADAAVNATPAPAPTPVRDLKSLANTKLAGPKPAPAAPAQQPSTLPPAALAALTTPAAESEAMRLVKTRMNESPEARKLAAMQEYERMVGKPDTAQHDRLIAELERRKEELAPKKGFEGLMEYLGEISRADSRGRGSFAAGAAGAARLNDLNKERKLQQFELSKQAIEVSQKKLDTVRAYAKDVYGIGKTAFDQVFKDQFDAAKEIVKDESEARKLAQENTLKLLQMENNLAVQALQNRGSLAVANARGAGSGSGDKQQLAELKALQTSLKDQLKTTFNKADRQRLQTQLDEVNMAVAQMAGLSTMGAAPGAGSPGGIPSDVQALLKKYGGK